MKKVDQVKDDRLAPWPKVFQCGDEMRIKVRVLTPLRLSVISELLIAPLVALWQVVAGAFIVVIIFYALEWANLFNYLPISKVVLTGVLVVPLVFWTVEIFCGYPLCRMLIGRNVTVKITHNSVSIKKGLLGFSQKLSRAQRIVFMHESFQYPRLPIYCRSEYFCVVVGDIRKERLLEIYNTEQLAALVTNLNVALMLLSRQKLDDMEHDPTERRSLRLRGQE